MYAVSTLSVYNVRIQIYFNCKFETYIRNKQYVQNILSAHMYNISVYNLQIIFKSVRWGKNMMNKCDMMVWLIFFSGSGTPFCFTFMPAAVCSRVSRAAAKSRHWHIKLDEMLGETWNLCIFVVRYVLLPHLGLLGQMCMLWLKTQDTLIYILHSMTLCLSPGSKHHNVSFCFQYNVSFCFQYGICKAAWSWLIPTRRP